MTTENALLADIIAKPEDDLCRLVYADWLEENGRGVRAGFIRVQVDLAVLGNHHPNPLPVEQNEAALKWLQRRERQLWRHLGPAVAKELGGVINVRITPEDDDQPPASSFGLVRSGFVDEIRCTLAEWCGGECPECVRYEYVRGVPTVQRLLNCRHCHGTGRTIGIGPQVVRKHPVTKVVLTDREPEFGNTGTMFRWTDSSNTDQSFSFRNSPQNQLPHDVFRLLKGWMLVPNRHPCIRWYASSDVALDALSDALIAWAKVKPVTTTELGCAIPHEEV